MRKIITYTLGLRWISSGWFSALGSRQTLESVPTTKDVIADHEVEKKRSSDTDPNEHVVSVDSNAFPIPVNPAPDLSLKLAVRFTLFFFSWIYTYSGLTKHKAAVRVSNQKQRNGNSKRATVTDEAIHPPPFTERIRAGAKEEDEEDVEGHG